jgi:hypothetical protein
MTKTITTIILVFFSAFSFAQNTDVESFMNQVYQRVVPSNHEYYNLVDSSFATEFDLYSLEKELLKVHPECKRNQGFELEGLSFRQSKSLST